MNDEEIIDLDDGTIITEVDRGDGSTGPFVLTEVTNDSGEVVNINLTWRECVRIASHMLDRATKIRDEAESNEQKEQGRISAVASE